MVWRVERLPTERKPDKHPVARPKYNLQKSFVGRYLDPVYNQKTVSLSDSKTLLVLAPSVIGILSLKAASISS